MEKTVKKREKRTGEDRIVTLPNALSLVRKLMIRFIIKSFYYGEYKITVAFIVLSGITDLLDGYSARKYHDTTKIGKMLDPTADKLTQLSLLYLLLLIYPMVRIIMVIFILKEFSMGMYNLYFMYKGHEYDGAIFYGKIATLVFYISMILIFLLQHIDKRISIFLLALTTAFLMISWVGHMIVYTRQYKTYKERGEI